MEYTNVEYPEHIFAIKEIAALSKVIDIEMEKLSAEIESIKLDTAIPSSTERGIARREQFLKIVPLSTASLDARKTDVLAKYNDRALYTEKYLRKTLDKMIGAANYRLEVDQANQKVFFRCSLTEKKKYQIIQELLERIIPLHIIIDSDLLYNPWDVIGHNTWAEMEEETWEHWKNEPLE